MSQYGEKPRSHIAVRRVPGRPPVEVTITEKPAGDDPGLTFSPLTVTPEACDGCDPGLAVTIEGQVFIASLAACDDELCYYDYPVTGLV